MIGRTQSANEVLFEVLQDRVFYESSGGGMTLSGGEPMHQFPFAFTLMRSAKHEGLHTCLETCGFAPTEQYRQMFPLTDLFLYDIKETDKDRHQDYTGVPLAPILHNLEVLNEAGAQIILRCPLIPGLNIRDDHFREVGRLAQRLDNVMRVEVEPYHPLGISKSERIGQKYPLPELAHFLPKDRTESCVAAISASCDKPVASLG
jgi:pyruvate formate lyase activating enzyme